LYPVLVSRGARRVDENYRPALRYKLTGSNSQ
jgi:hypothetical protein